MLIHPVKSPLLRVLPFPLGLFPCTSQAWSQTPGRRCSYLTHLLSPQVPLTTGFRVGLIFLCVFVVGVLWGPFLILGLEITYTSP